MNTYDIFDLNYDRNIIRVDPYYQENPESRNIFQDGVSPNLIISGGLQGNLEMEDGHLQSKNYEQGVSGWIIRYDGFSQLSDLELIGGTIRYGKEDFDDNFHAGYILSPEGFYFGTALDARYLKYDIDAGTLDYVGDISGSKITGSLIQTAGTGRRIVMDSSYPDKLRFMDGTSEVGGIEVNTNSLRLFGPSGEIVFGTAMGASEVGYVNLPFFQGSGKASSGSVSLIAPDTKVGLTWWGGGYPYFDLYQGSYLARVGSDLLPYSSGNYNLGNSSYRWSELHTNSITLGGVTKYSWDTGGVTSLSELTIDTSKYWVGYGITGVGDITPYYDGWNYLGSSSFNWERLYLSDGIYYGGSQYIELNSKGVDLWMPLGLRQYSSPPGSASSYLGFMYYDTSQQDIVFSNGDRWHKVSATAI